MNPFERFDLDPNEGPAAITERLRELLEDAKDDAARAEIRAAWEELTLHPARRVKAALFAHPETRPPLGVAPPSPRLPAPREIALEDVIPRPSVLAALGGRDATPLPLTDDPLLAPSRPK